MKVPKIFPGMFFLIGGLLSGFDASLLADSAGGLAGIVKDSRGAPLAGVAVSLLRGQFNAKVVQTVTTDGTGRFEMRGLVPGLYSLKANLTSYLPFIQSQVGVVAGKIADLTLILENLYLQSILGVSAGSSQEPIREDIESVLRSASSTRPILRVFEADGSREEEEDRGVARNRNGIRGVVGFSTAAYSTPELASAGSTFTDFAFIKDVGTSTTWVVAGVVSDSGFAELDSLLRFRESDRHGTSVRLSLGILPYLSSPLSPVPDQNVRRLNMYNLDVQDELKLSEIMSVIYGAELQMTDPGSSASRFRPRWGLRFRPSAGSRYSFLRTKSLPQMQRTLELGEGDDLDLPSPFQHDFGNRLNLGFNRVTHTEAETEQTLGASSRLGAGVYSDDVTSNHFASNTGSERSSESRGVRLTYRQSLGAAESVVGYTYGSGLQSDRNFSEFAAHNFHVVAARIRSKLPLTHTQVAATYRWVSGDSITIVDPYQTVFESNSPGLSLAFIQAIPYFGKFIPGKIEAQLDVRNLFGRSTPELYQSANLRRVEFLQPARSVRGGIKLKF